MKRNDFYEDLIRYIISNKGKVLGALIGLTFGILFLVLGFFKTILILMCTFIGYLIGARIDIDGSLKKLLDRILPPIFK